MKKTNFIKPKIDIHKISRVSIIATSEQEVGPVSPSDPDPFGARGTDLIDDNNDLIESLKN